MVYQVKKNWQYDEVVTEQDMNRIESGIEENQQNLTTHLAEKASLTKIGHTQLSNEIYSTDVTKAATSMAVKSLNDISAKKLYGYFPLKDANLVTDFSSYAFANDSINTPPGGDGWSTIATFPGLEAADRAIQIGNNWNDMSGSYWIRRKENTGFVAWEKLITNNSAPWLTAILQNGWSGTISYRKGAKNQLEIYLKVTSGVVSAGTIITTLPVGYRIIESYVTQIPVIFKENLGMPTGCLIIDGTGNIRVADNSFFSTGNNLLGVITLPMDGGG
ncbi:phage tail protein [Psychrobacillus sp.]|uniref:phage tail protein n=1 Tax=Psychrobacillus sp. TaxID=1871623 RepID=UPI0028BDB2E0|nr:phage tail protein [Psychrobacillus sp.]